MPTPHAYDLLHRIQATSSLNTLTEIADAHFNNLGFEKFAYVILDLPQKKSLNKAYVSNYPKEWQQRYKTRDYFHLDPLYDIARKRKNSFVWGEDEEIVPLNDAQKAFFQESGDVGTHQGMSIPLLLPRGGFCLLSLCSDSMNAKALQRYLAHIEPTLIVSALMLHQGVTAMPEQAQTINAYQLTAAEQETLYWLCQNKTYEDIGLILGLGREGVSERLRKVYRKMDAVGKVDAVKKAISSGLFQLQ